MDKGLMDASISGCVVARRPVPINPILHPLRKGARVIVTCGPSYEPIDAVRRLTNFSTGGLGVQLANRLSSAGFRVTCFKGAGATCQRSVEAEAITFTTNDDLRARLIALEKREEVRAVFHAAALGDFRVKSVAIAGGGSDVAKISSRAGEVTITLEPAAKLIAELRALFPRSRIVGWKYELDGTREVALAKGRKQLEENATDVCVVNGAAYGNGFGVCERGLVEVPHFETKGALCDWLAGWLASEVAP